MDFTFERQVVLAGYDRKAQWFAPRAAVDDAGRAVMIMNRSHLAGSDLFTAPWALHSDDAGRSWSTPAEQLALDRQAGPDGIEQVPCDLVPGWHAGSGTFLATGHTAAYRPGENHPVVSNEARRDVAWAIWDDQARAWTRWGTLEIPDADAHFWLASGSSQRVDLPDGRVLLPAGTISRADLGESMWKGCFATVVLACRYDGQSLTLEAMGPPMRVAEPRGLYEPSLAAFGGRFYLTLRNDIRGYVAVSDDGMNFTEPTPWRFDDGEELGSVNTQQHWIACGGRLYLVYTRRGLDNDDIVRWRAPLVMARVDPGRLVVLRATEQILVPKLGATLGNFGCNPAGPGEAWVTVAEAMQNGKRGYENLATTEAAGADNRVYLVRIR
jgi:hypothetical protein